MSLESFDQKFPIPDADGSKWECCRTDFPGKGTLNPADLIFYVLCLLTQGSFATVGSDALDRVSDTQCFSTYSVRHNWEIRWQQTIVVNEKHVRKMFGNVTANKLGNNL